jgi:hypothetical protein
VGERMTIHKFAARPHDHPTLAGIYDSAEALAQRIPTLQQDYTL